MEICQGLPDGAPLVLNADDDLLPTAQIPGRLRPVWFGIRSSSADVRAINIHTVGEGTGFTLVDNVDGETYEFSVTIPTAGVHTVYDALLLTLQPPAWGWSVPAPPCAGQLSDHRYAPEHCAARRCDLY